MRQELKEKLITKLGEYDAPKIIEVFDEMNIVDMELPPCEIVINKSAVSDIRLLKEKLRNISETGRTFEISVNENEIIIDTKTHHPMYGFLLSPPDFMVSMLIAAASLTLAKVASNPKSESPLEAFVKINESLQHSMSSVIKKMNSPVFGSLQNELYSLDKLVDKTPIDSYNPGAIVPYR